MSKYTLICAFFNVNLAFFSLTVRILISGHHILQTNVTTWLISTAVTRIAWQIRGYSLSDIPDSPPESK